MQKSVAVGGIKPSGNGWGSGRRTHKGLRNSYPQSLSALNLSIAKISIFHKCWRSVKRAKQCRALLEWQFFGPRRWLDLGCIKHRAQMIGAIFILQVIPERFALLRK